MCGHYYYFFKHHWRFFSLKKKKSEKKEKKLFHSYIPLRTVNTLFEICKHIMSSSVTLCNGDQTQRNITKAKNKF